MGVTLCVVGVAITPLSRTFGKIVTVNLFGAVEWIVKHAPIK